MWVSEIKYRALFHSSCTTTSTPELKEKFVLQWRYFEEKGSLPSFADNVLHNICDDLCSLGNLFRPINIIFLQDEWYEIVCYSILIAAYYEMQYEKFISTPSISPPINETKLSTDCFWNSDLVYKIILKYKKFIRLIETQQILQLDFDIVKISLPFFQNDSKEALLVVQILRNMNDRERTLMNTIAEHVFIIQKIDVDKFRIIETHFRKIMDLRYSLFERKKYGLPYSWEKSFSSLYDAHAFLKDSLNDYLSQFYFIDMKILKNE